MQLSCWKVGVAGQRILGQIFQPSVFGVFLVLSIYLFLRQQPFWSLVPIAVAATVHPVYLLGGALLTIAYMGMLFRAEHNLKRPLLLGVTALLLVAPVLTYTIYVFWDPDPMLAQEALNILVNFRNPQHALVSSWLNWTVLVQVLVLLTGLLIVRKTRLFPSSEHYQRRCAFPDPTAGVHCQPVAGHDLPLEGLGAVDTNGHDHPGRGCGHQGHGLDAKMAQS